MAQLTELDVRILEHAQRLELGQIKPTDTTRNLLGLSPARYTQKLMHLAQAPEVIADPRWTMMAHRIQKVMSRATAARASRSFRSAG
jgi:hypothetical protein